MTRSLVLSISMSVEDSESRRFELNIWLSFSQADLGPTSGQEWFFSFFFGKVCNFFFFEDFVLIASGTTVTVAVTRQMCDYSRVKASFAVNICTCSCILLILRDSCSVCVSFSGFLCFFLFFFYVRLVWLAVFSCPVRWHLSCLHWLVFNFGIVLVFSGLNSLVAAEFCTSLGWIRTDTDCTSNVG